MIGRVLARCLVVVILGVLPASAEDEETEDLSDPIVEGINEAINKAGKKIDDFPLLGPGGKVIEELTDQNAKELEGDATSVSTTESDEVSDEVFELESSSQKPNSDQFDLSPEQQENSKSEITNSDHGGLDLSNETSSSDDEVVNESSPADGSDTSVQGKTSEFMPDPEPQDDVNPEESVETSETGSGELESSSPYEVLGPTSDSYESSSDSDTDNSNSGVGFEAYSTSSSSEE